jgi:putative transposase
VVAAPARHGKLCSGEDGGNYPPVLKEADRAFIRERLAGEPHLALRALQAELAARGTKASYGAIWNFVHADGLSFKKKHPSPTSARDLTLRGGAGAGRAFRVGSILPGWSSSTRPG